MRYSNSRTEYRDPIERSYADHKDFSSCEYFSSSDYVYIHRNFPSEYDFSFCFWVNTLKISTLG